MNTGGKKTGDGCRLWECLECGNNGELEAWSYATLVEKGHPVCPSCHYDMRLVPGQN